MADVSARDRAKAIEIVKETQYLQALALTSTRAQLIARAREQRPFADRFARIAESADGLSKAFKERLAADVKWDDVARLGELARGENADQELKALWAGIRKTIRPLAAALADAVGSDPAAAFAIDPVQRTKVR